MNLKITLGIIIPSLIILVLAILGSVDIGFSLKKNFDQQIPFSEVFKKQYNQNAIRIGEIELTNDYFLARKLEAPTFLVCLVDNELKRPIKNAGALFYNEGEYSPDTRSLEMSVLQSKSLSDYSGYSGYYANQGKKVIEVNPYHSKKLQIYFSSESSYYYPNQKDGTEREYDSVLIMQQNQNSKLACGTLSSEEMQKAIKLSISNPPEGYCYDSDEYNRYSNADEYYAIRDKLAVVGTCSDDSSHSDFCLNSENLTEYSCATVSNKESCKAETYNCKTYGYRTCSNGICIY